MNSYNEPIEIPGYKKLKELDEATISNLKRWYQEAIQRKTAKLICLTLFLVTSSISQFIILDYSFVISFGLDKNSPDFLITAIPIFFIGFLVTAALPITTFVDEFKLLNKSIEINFLGIKFSPIVWIILPCDFLLTFQAIFMIGIEEAKFKWVLSLLAFVIAAIFATAALYVSRGIAASFAQLSEAKKNLQILEAYRVNPVDLYEDIEQIRLRKSLDDAIKDRDQIRSEAEIEISKIIAEKQDVLAQKNKEAEQFTTTIKEYEQSITSLNQLRAKFNKI
jgi:hypothetical protein